MRILVILPDNPERRILVELEGRQHIKNIKDLIKLKVYPEAIDVALQKGKLEREFRADESENLKTDLILHKDSAYWHVKGEE